jgi:membrane associated rhomboid family serine protease
VRQASGRFGGSITTSGARVTQALVVINVVLYIIELAHSQLGFDWEMVGFGRFPGGPFIGVGAGQWYRLITSAFLPPAASGGLGLLDIAFNMWALLIVGPAVEKVLGAGRYLTVYLISALGGSVLVYLLVPFEQAAGASGAIFGLFGAWFVLARRLGLDYRLIVTLIVLNLILSFSWHAIAWQAHVGGLIAGGLLTAAYAYAPRKNRTAIQVGATVAMLVIIAIGVIIGNHLILGTYSFYQGRLF